MQAEYEYVRTLEHNTVATYQAMAKTSFTAALTLLVAIPHLAEGQEPAPTRFAVESYRGSTLVGEDEYVLAPPNAEGGRNGILRSNVFIASRGERISTEIDFGIDWIPIRIKFSIEGPGGLRTWTQFGDRRITFRSVTAEGETARELPRRGVVIAYDTDVPSLLSALQYLPPGPATLFSIRTATVSHVTLIDHGFETRTEGGDTGQLRHVELVTQDGSLHCWYDQDNSLILVEIPHTGIRVVPRNP